MMATRSPTKALLEYQVPATAAKAPMSMNPSRAMFVTPERSERRPPMPAKIRGAAERSVAVNNATEKKLNSVSSEVLPPSNPLWWWWRLHQRLARVVGRPIACHVAHPGSDASGLPELLRHRQGGNGEDDEAQQDVDDVAGDAGRVLHLGRPG